MAENQLVKFLEDITVDALNLGTDVSRFSKCSQHHVSFQIVLASQNKQVGFESTYSNMASTIDPIETTSSVDELNFVDKEYLYTTFTLTSLSKDELEILVQAIKESLFFKDTVNVGSTRTLEVYKSLSDLDTQLHPKEFFSYVHSKSSDQFFHLQEYNKKTDKLDMYDETIDRTFIIEPIFKTNENDNNSDSFRLQITEFFFMNNPIYRGPFEKSLKKVTEEVMKVAKSIHPDFTDGLSICSILCSLPGGNAQTVHQDDWRIAQKDDMLSCIVSLQTDTKLQLAKRFNKNKNKRKKVVPHEINIHQGTGVLFSGKTKHAGCAYEDLNIRLHYFIFKKEAEDTYTQFARDLKQITIACDICGTYVQPYNEKGRKNMSIHKKRHGEQGLEGKQAIA